MASVTGVTAEKALAIEANSVVGAHFDGSNHLILEKPNAVTVDAGAVPGGAGGFSPVSANIWPGSSEMAQGRNGAAPNPYRFVQWQGTGLADFYDPYGSDTLTWVGDPFSDGTITISETCWFQIELNLWQAWATDPGWASVSAIPGGGNASGASKVSGKPLQSNASNASLWEWYAHILTGPIFADGSMAVPIKIEYGDVDYSSITLSIAVTRLT